MEYTLQALDVPVSEGELRALEYRPAGGSGGLRPILVCPPFFEERKCSARVLHQIAASLASRGSPVLRVDYFGTGESPGETRGLSLERTSTDLVELFGFVRRRYGAGGFGLIGLRLGATLAAQAVRASADGGDCRFLVLLEPVRSVALHLREMISARAHGIVDAGGYPMPDQLLNEARAMRVDVSGLGRKAPTLVAQIGGKRASRGLRRFAQSAHADFRCIDAAPFWRSLRVPIAEPVVSATTEWIEGLAATERQAGSAGASEHDLLVPVPSRNGARRPREELVEIPSRNGLLRGVYHGHDGAEARPPVLVVFLHGWSGCRTGPHRMFVEYARALARAGVAALRIDFSGRGDSEGDPREASVRHAVEDAVAGIRYVRSRKRPHRIVLLGLCSGADVGFLAAAVSPKVDGLVLISLLNNALRPSRADRVRLFAERLAPYYGASRFAAAAGRAFDRGFHLRNWLGLVGHGSPESEASSTDLYVGGLALEKVSAPILLVHASDVLSRRSRSHFESELSRCPAPKQFRSVTGADKGLYSVRAKDQVLAIVQDWIQSNWPTPASTNRPARDRIATRRHREETARGTGVDR
ncbi:MAG: alpha/beta fold hydrolase [bacterium]|nr:alpha/beta fold hydrolase [bacterium]